MAQKAPQNAAAYPEEHTCGGVFADNKIMPAPPGNRDCGRSAGSQPGSRGQLNPALRILQDATNRLPDRRRAGGRAVGVGVQEVNMRYASFFFD